MKTYVFIDGNNLHLGVTKGLGWDIDYKKFQTYLFEKYKATKIFLFLGYREDMKYLYANLKKYGYTLIFKSTKDMGDGNFKGNVDVDLTVKCMELESEYSEAIVISADGDFAALYKYLTKKEKLFKIGIPHKYSSFLKPYIKYFFFLKDLKNKIERKKERTSIKHKS